MTELASEYGRLLAERDRLVALGVDPAVLDMPLPPPRGAHMTGPDPIDDTAPETPDSDPRDDHVGETGQSLGDADPTGPEDHPGVPE